MSKSDRLRTIALLVERNENRLPEDDLPGDEPFEPERAQRIWDLSVTSSVMANKRAGDRRGIVRGWPK